LLWIQDYAKKIVREIISLSSTILTIPERGRIVPETNQKEIRELFIYSYRLIYQISPDLISILAVIHGSRNITATNIQND
jgi:plasmid stabilization system protein ParE